MKRTVTIALAMAAVAIAATALPAGAAKKPRPMTRPHGNFVSHCGFSHRLSDDPIVFPGVAGASHSHDFLGNTSTNASSTFESLRANPATTCRRPGDEAAYWVPTLSQNGVQLAPLFALVYYKTGGHAPGTIKPFPAGLRVIAGNSKATTAQPLSVAGWGCVAGSNVKDTTEPPTCPQGFPLVLRVHFPDCWDGVNLDSPDHKSHLSYSTRGRCDAGHPVAVPQLNLFVRYPTLGGSGIALASGGITSGHADFFNSWNQVALTRDVNLCLNTMTVCGQRGPIPPKP